MSTETDVNIPEKTDLERYEDQLATLAVGTAEHSAKLDIVNYLKEKNSQEAVIETPRESAQHKLGTRALRRLLEIAR